MQYLRPAKFNTMHRVDSLLLEVELTARRIKCEVPTCNGTAVTVYSDEMPSFICRSHDEVRRSGLAFDVKAVIATHMRRLVLEAANRAYAGSHDEVVFAYQPGVTTARYMQMPPVPHMSITDMPSPFEASAPLVRPSIKLLPESNSDMPLLDFFPLL